MPSKPLFALILFGALVTVTLAKAEQSHLAADSDTVSLKFVDEDVSKVIALYERLIHQNVVQDNFVQGKITVTAAEPVSREEAMLMIERTLFANYFAIVQIDSDTVSVTGTGRNPRSNGVPIIADPRDLPAHERVVSYLYRCKYYEPVEIQQILGQYLSPPQPYTSVLPVPNGKMILLTDRSSVLRRLLEVMDKIDVPEGSHQ